MYIQQATMEGSNSKKPNNMKHWISNKRTLLKTNFQTKTPVGSSNSVLMSPSTLEFFSKNFGNMYYQKIKREGSNIDNYKPVNDSKNKIFSTQENHSSRGSSEDFFYSLISDTNTRKRKNVRLINNQHHSVSHSPFVKPQNSLITLAELFEEYKNVKDSHRKNDIILPKIKEKYEIGNISENNPDRKTMLYISQSPMKNRKESNHFTITPEINRDIYTSHIQTNTNNQNKYNPLPPEETLNISYENVKKFSRKFLQEGIIENGIIINKKPNDLKNLQNSISKKRSKIDNENSELKQQEKINNTLHIIIEEKQNIFSSNKISNGLSLLSYMNIINSSKYKFCICSGNNSSLVRSIIKKRSWWIELPLISSLSNFKWQPFSNGIRFESLGMANTKQLFNHFEFHKELTRKNNLFLNMQAFLEEMRENVFNCVPITFNIEINISNCTSKQISLALHNFSHVFKVLEANKQLIHDINNIKEKIEYLIAHQEHSLYNNTQPSIPPLNGQKLIPQGFDRKGIPICAKFTLPLSHFSGTNLWILKPTTLNRGRGIHIFSSLIKLKEIITNYAHSKNASSINTPNLKKNNNNELNVLGIEKDLKKKTFTQEQEDLGQGSKAIDQNQFASFIIQKYIENPFLINNRKFDIRIWVLISNELDCYIFKEGYIRTSCSYYNTEDTEDRFVHLTNNAIQKYSDNYGKYEDGNQLSFADFQRYLDNNENNKENYKEKKISFAIHILPNIKSLIIKSVLSVRKLINQDKRKYCFEIFGYDFIIDSDLNTWLIEVNTNPCLEESSRLLKMLIPRMLDDAFKLTVDVLFPPPANLFYNEIYPVDNYTDYENLWEKLCSLQDYNSLYLVSPTYLKSEYLISINEQKKFKVKKNESFSVHPGISEASEKSTKKKAKVNNSINKIEAILQKT